MPVASEQLRATLRRWPSGVTIVAASNGGTLAGMTVSSFASVSLEPPQILVCIERGTRTHEAISASGAFGVSVLSESQQEWAMRFGGQIPETSQRFDGLKTHTLLTGSPLLDGGIALLDCTLVATHEGGTHTIFVGLVEASAYAEDDPRPLLYFNTSYARLPRDDA